MQTASGATYFSLQITQQLSFQSRAPQYKAQHPRKINSTTTCVPHRACLPSLPHLPISVQLLFSCCCARVDFSWVFRTVCDCYANHWKCDDTCLSDALIQDSLFYTTGVVSYRLLMSIIHAIQFMRTDRNWSWISHSSTHPLISGWWVIPSADR